MVRKTLDVACAAMISALGVLLLSVGGAKASTVFAATGAATGEVTIDTVTGSIISGDLKVSGISSDLTNLIFSQTTPARFEFADAATGIGDRAFFSFPPTSTLVGFSGGTAGTSSFTNCVLPGTVNCSVSRIGDTTFTATPLPAALPLFATGIGGLGLLGWRRKRKALAVA